MDDTFLYRLRIRPSPEFAARLEARLDAQFNFGLFMRSASVVRILTATLVLGAAAAAVNLATVERVADVPVDAPRLAEPISPRPTSNTLTQDSTVRETPISAVQEQRTVTQSRRDAPTQASKNAMPSAYVVTGAAANELIRVDGSSVVFPLTEAVAEEFQIRERGRVRVTVGIGGTGGGFKKFCRNEIDIANAARPIRSEELEVCAHAGIEFIELPVAYDALAVIVNADNTWVDALSIDELKKIWEPAAQGRIVRWNLIRQDWPNRPIALAGPDVDSPAYDYFTEAVVGRAKASRQDFARSEFDNMIVESVLLYPGSLAFGSYSEFDRHASKLKVVGIVNSQGISVSPGIESIVDGTYEPLSRPLFIYVKATSAQRPGVKRFVEYYLSRAGTLSSEVNHVPLAGEAYATALEKFNRGTTGTALSGRPQTGVSVDAILVPEKTISPP